MHNTPKTFVCVLAWLITTPTGAVAVDQIAARPVVEIGSETGSYEETFFDVVDLAVAPSGRLYVLDYGDRMVKVFDGDGGFVRAFGGEGGGPGEFRQPVSIALDSMVRIFDAGQRRESVFDLEGEHIRTRRIVAPDQVNPKDSFQMRSGHWVVSTVGAFSPGRPEHDPFVHVVAYKPQVLELDTLANIHSGGTLWTVRGQTLPWGIATSDFGPGGAWAVSGDSMAVIVNGYDGFATWYRFDEEGTFHVVNEKRIPVTSETISGDDLAAVEEQYREERRDRPDYARQIDLHPPPAWSGATRALFDDRGKLWVETRHGKAAAVRWLVIEPDGDTQEVCVPDSVELMAVQGDHLYGVSTTPNGAEIVQVLRMETPIRGNRTQCR